MGRVSHAQAEENRRQVVASAARLFREHGVQGVSVADLMGIADSGGIMPPKSTWFEPKLRDGLLSHLL